ncbi:MAG: hypothetical protein A2Y62_05655 [Candidatus Fischerbacteria bacterium RBG_13_37_8]|uniref:Tetratricopeptide repeat-like domain-containing protein n=1 Tax=Candidatus Fischerbacteria bacterium RBG_13_37_8 TaxID=1817863 RepID=A0A1F5VXP5_9BACT|nr:MAG: hypothetical protein A2Y62_05655 [Candidatus Fischerbacteria bacterium RBG_13_37_8]
MKYRLLALLSLSVIAVFFITTSAQAEWDKGVQCFKAKDYKCAETEFKQVIELNPEHYAGYYMMGLTLVEMQKITDAEKNFLSALKYAPKDYGSNFHLALIYGKKKDSAKVIQYTSQALAADKISQNERGFALKLRAEAYMKSQKYDKAEKDLSDAMRLLPIDEDLVYLSGVNAYSLRKYDTAYQYLNQTYGKKGGNGTHALLLMDSANQTRNYQKAREIGETFANKGTKDESILSQLAISYLALNDYSQAIATLKKLPDKSFKYMQLSQAYVSTKDWIAAEKLLLEWKQKEPKNSKCQELLGHVYINTKRPYEALEAFKTGQSLANANEKARFQPLIDNAKEYIEKVLGETVKEVKEHEQKEKERTTKEEDIEKKDTPKQENNTTENKKKS